MGALEDGVRGHRAVAVALEDAELHAYGKVGSLLPVQAA